MKPPKSTVSGFEDGLSSDEDDSGDALLNSGLFKVKETTKPTVVEAKVLHAKKNQQKCKSTQILGKFWGIGKVSWLFKYLFMYVYTSNYRAKRIHLHILGVIPQQ